MPTAFQAFPGQFREGVRHIKCDDRPAASMKILNVGTDSSQYRHHASWRLRQYISSLVFISLPGNCVVIGLTNYAR